MSLWQAGIARHKKKARTIKCGLFSILLYASARTVTGCNGGGNNRGDQADITHYKILSW
ncbi:hypothetical protein RBA63_10430 [Brenneria goodwinii]|nr:hypothetical protein [Brenneria goodwinii]